MCAAARIMALQPARPRAVGSRSEIADAASVPPSPERVKQAQGATFLLDEVGSWFL